MLTNTAPQPLYLPYNTRKQNGQYWVFSAASVHKPELLIILWAQFLEFLAALIAITFGLILFLIREKFKKWFGYRSD
jgi:hypothetical protein